MTQIASMLRQALALHQQGELHDALRIYQEVLREQPDHFDALHLHGVAALQSGLTEAGIGSIRKAIAVNTTIATAHVSLGNGLRDLGRPREAIASYDTALSLDPGHAQGWHNRGNALVDLGQYEAAIISFDKAIGLRPDFAEAYNGRGGALWKLKRPEQAVASYDRALALRPDLAVAYHNRGNILPYLNRPDEALASQDRAIALQPGLAEAHSGRGNALWELGRPEEALASYHRAVTLKPGYADAHWNAGLCLLQLGRFEPGWRLFEWRKRLDEPMGLRDFKQPLWTGDQDVSGKTLFLYWEQGLGDTIQFCRYAKLATARGAKVIMEVQAPLARLLGGLGSGISVMVSPKQLPAFDYHCPLMSLPLAFRTELATIPAEHRYLGVEDDIRARWSNQIGLKTKPRIGLVWAGGGSYGGDRKRSTNLTTCLPLLDLDAEWICLQKEIGGQDAAVLSDARRIAFFGDGFQDFSDTAGLIDLLDLVITVDTSVAHLAAAMGKPVWIMLPYSSDWRWLRDRDDSPWYPTVRLFRQQKVGDWPGVINRVVDALRTWLATRADEARRWFRQGNALLAQQRSEEAIACYETAIILNPGDPDARTNRGNALLQLKRPADAVASYDAAITVRPDNSVAFHNRGNALLDMRCPAAAVASYDRAIALNPNVAETHGARGNALWELRRPEEALASFRSAMALKPDHADAIWNAGLCLLQMGRMEEGSRLFEWRKKLDLRVAARSYPQPLWLGEQDIAGKTLFVYWEQGLGDTIQFCRYAKLAADRGAKVIMEVQPPLYRLLKQFSPSIHVIGPDETTTGFDFHCPLLSLPLAFRTRPETIPAAPRYLWAEAERCAHWARRLGPRRKPRIGVVWAGSPGHRHDRDRSMELTTFAALFTDDADWICLQKDLRATDRALPGHLAYFGDSLNDFTDTAALVDLMDLVITVDTSVAHLAAAMGKTVWILLPYSPDWRWFLDRDDSPWYPTVKLFRQQSHADWHGVIDQVRHSLQDVL